jgi:hypothetical protein
MYKEKYSVGDNSRNLLSRKLSEGISGLKPVASFDEAPSNIW